MDIDIDFQSDFNPNQLFERAVKASMIRKGLLVNHPCGQYFQHIKKDSITGFAAIPYEKAEELSYIKFDFLHLSLLDNLKSKGEIQDLVKKDPDWDLLLDYEVVQKLFHVHKHYDILQQVQPRSVQELADVIATIRPNKRRLLNDYIQNKEKIRPLLYRQEYEDKAAFRRGHAIAYALNVIVQLHLIKQSRL